MNKPWLKIDGGSPLVAIALHAGHEVDPKVKDILALTDQQRLREEDPFTDILARIALSCVIVRISRFQVDLNRSPEFSVYMEPSQSWGLQVWKQTPSHELLVQLHTLHHSFYREMYDFLQTIHDQFGRILLLTVHSYMRDRRPNQADIDVGTWTDPVEFRPVIDAFKASMVGARVGKKRLVIRENSLIGKPTYFEEWFSRNFPKSGYLSIEIAKELFMTEDFLDVIPERLAVLRGILAQAITALSIT